MANAVDERKPEATRLGSYEILRKLARGGMAEIFLARTKGPLGFEKLVVLKKILPQYAASPRFVQLFLDEARLAAGLDHPHIAAVYDMGTVEGHYFFTMEYVHGQDVRAMLQRTDKAGRQLPLEIGVQVARNVAAALHYAHERHRPDGTLLDIVHRDVSPSNVIVSYDGAVKLVDFGVAKAASSSIKTRTGTLKGKVAYMSPEQARGAPLDRRSDIFSLGIMLWEMVTNRRLFRAENDLATIQMIVNTAAPPPSIVRPEMPVELERIILRALAQNPGARYQTAQELQLDLEELARENKLNQSSVALSGFMTHMFAVEIRAWKDAQANGVTLTDHVVSEVIDAVEPQTTSDSEIDVDDAADADDDPDELPSYTAAPPTTRLGAMPGTLPGTFAAFVSAGTRSSFVPDSMNAPFGAGPAAAVPTVGSGSFAQLPKPTVRLPAPPRSRAKAIFGVVLGAAIAIGAVIGVVAGSRDDDVPATPAATPAATPTETAPAAEPARAEPPPVVAPAVAPPVVAPEPEPVPAAEATVSTEPDRKPQRKKRDPKRDRATDRPADRKPDSTPVPVKKPPKFDPNAPLPPS